MNKTCLLILLSLSMTSNASPFRWWAAPRTQPAAPGGLNTNADAKSRDLIALQRQAYRLTRPILVKKTLKDLENERDAAATLFKDMEQLHRKLIHKFPLEARTRDEMTIVTESALLLRQAEKNYREKNEEYQAVQRRLLP